MVKKNETHVRLLVHMFWECWCQETGCCDPKWVEMGAGGLKMGCWGSKQGAGGPRRAAGGRDAWLGWWWVETYSKGLKEGAGGLKRVLGGLEGVLVG